MRTAIAYFISALIALSAGGVGGYIGLRWGRRSRTAIANASTPGERTAARLEVAHRLTLAVVAAIAFLVGFIIKVGMPRWLIIIAVIYAVLSAIVLDLQARW